MREKVERENFTHVFPIPSLIHFVFVIYLFIICIESASLLLSPINAHLQFT